MNNDRARNLVEWIAIVLILLAVLSLVACGGFLYLAYPLLERALG